jgi:hypothetical protein
MPKTLFWPVLLVGVAILAAAASLVLRPGPGAAPAAPSKKATPPVSANAAPSIGFDDMPTMPDATRPGIPQSLESYAGPAEAWDSPAAPWEDSINKLLESNDDNNKVAAAMAALMPSLPVEGQIEAVQHVVNLLEDDQYELAGRLLLNPSLHPDVREIMFADLLNRASAVRLPALLALLGMPGHPLHNEARDHLRDAVGSDLGGNPAAWNAAVQEVVAKEAAEVDNPDVFPGAFEDGQQP